MKRTAIEVFNQTIQIFQDQWLTQDFCNQDSTDRIHLEPNDKETERISINYEKLKSQLGEIHNSRECMEQEMKTQANENRKTAEKMNSLKPDLIKLRKIRDQYLL